MSEPDKNTPPLGGPQKQQAAQAKEAKPEGVGGPQWYRALNGGQVSRPGGVFIVPAGDVLNGSTHDLKALERAGIKLEPCDPPEWFVANQAAEQERIAEAAREKRRPDRRL